MLNSYVANSLLANNPALRICVKVTYSLITHIQKNIEATPLTIDKIIALCLIHKGSAVSPSDLCRLIQLHKAQITKIVNDLVDRGFVEREVDKNDRRKLQLTLSIKGKALAEQYNTILSHHPKETDNELTSYELELYERMVDVKLSG